MGVVEEASKWIGKVKYVFGGDNVEGGEADCSSFVRYVFRKNGVELPRVADDQSRVGTDVAKENLMAGDLVFFQGTYNTAGASHVGIYIGNGKFIDCGSTGVRVSDLNSSYWSQHWYKAKRVDGMSGAVAGSPNLSGGISGGGLFVSSSGNMPWYKDVAVFLVVIIAVILGVFFFAKGFGFTLNPF